jgi:hypothetical protein
MVSDDRRMVLTRATADSLLVGWPQVERDTTLAQILRANTETLTICADRELWWPDVHPVLFRSGSSLGDAGLVAAAITYWQQMEAAALDHLGPDNPSILSIRHNLAGCRGEAGDAAGAATALEQLLEDYLRVLGLTTLTP